MQKNPLSLQNTPTLGSRFLSIPVPPTLITTIGTSTYSATTYAFSSQECFHTCYVAEAICQIKGIRQVIVLLTAAAREKHWQSLSTLLTSHGIEVWDRDIPDGQTETETWQIFDCLVDAIAPQSQVIFDITHAFRSIPLFVLLAAVFLRKAKQVEIQGLYYGMYQPGAESPIIDLTPAVRLMDWLTATDQFIATGSSLELGQLLKEIHRDFYQQNHPKKQDPKPKILQNFGSTIQDISRSIELIRPISLIEEDLPKLARQSTADLSEEVGTFAKPFGLLLETIQSSYATLALSDSSDSRQQIEKQFALLKWYVSKQFSAQAILLAREWVVSVLCLSEGIEDYRERQHRQAIEYQLGSLNGQGDSPSLAQPITTHVQDPRQLANFWNQLSEYRNDVAHVQMRKSPFSGKVLEEFALYRLIPTLEFLFPNWTGST